MSINRIEWDRLVDPSPTRNLTTILTVLPWLYCTVRDNKKGKLLQDICEVLLMEKLRITGAAREKIKSIYERSKSLLPQPTSKKEADSLLEHMCHFIATTYFEEFSQECTGRY